jgi:glycosyltransferase involved in cell wall biosynthesis
VGDLTAQQKEARRPTVAVVFRYVHHYRREFYERVRALLDEHGVDFLLVAGQPGPLERPKRDAVRLPWAIPICNRYWRVGQRELCWQPCLRLVWGADLVIVEQAAKLLANYALLAGRHVGGPRVALWGHGRNVQPHRASALAEAVKRVLSRHVDWWFAYNATSVGVVRDLGYPPERITCVQNAVDTRSMSAARDALSDEDVAAVRRDLQLEGEHVGVFAGALYDDKRLAFLIAAADRVRQSLPDFELLVIGSGPDEGLVRRAAASRPWLHVLGPLYGLHKVRAMATAQALLLPGLVGLGILDGFALGLPLVTSRVPFHSHEIAYLVPGENGIMVEEWRDPAAYADAVVRLLTDRALLSRLSEGCRAAADTYTIEAMAEHFADGVTNALTALGRLPAAPSGRC